MGWPGQVARHGALGTSEARPTPTVEGGYGLEESADGLVYTPMRTTEDAIARSLDSFPDDANPHGVVAKLIDFKTLQSGSVGPGEARQPGVARRRSR